MHDLNQFIENPYFIDLANSLSEYLYIVDRNGRLLFLNHAAENFEKINLESVRGKHIDEIYTQDESPTLRALETGSIVEEHENIYMIDGKEFRQLAVSKPIYNNQEIIGAYTIQRDITTMKQILSDNIALQKEKSNYISTKKKDFSSLIGEDPEFLHCIRLAKAAAQNDSPVLLAGHTGSGKEIFANAIHNCSGRSDQPFLAINCAAIPEGLLESLLFGTTKGSFTGSIDKEGIFEQAKGGTLFLDEINSMSLKSQAKILRVLEEKELRRLGGAIDIRTDVRIISSINTMPAIALEKGQLREDLFYRLSVTSVSIPPIVNRKGDIALLTDYFIEKYNQQFGKTIAGLDKETTGFFMSFPWPGNVRQLKHVVESAVNITDASDTLLHISDLPQYLFDSTTTLVEKANPTSSTDIAEHMSQSELQSPEKKADSTTNITAENLFQTIQEKEKNEIIQALVKSNGNVSKAARQLSMNRQNLVYRMKKYHIKR